MTHVNPPAAQASTVPSPMTAAPVHRHLDRARFLAGVAERRQVLADLEARLATACEQRAARGRASTVRIDDRATWDRPTWNRYLAAAAELEPEYGPRMRRLWQEIGQLERLAELPVAAAA